MKRRRFLQALATTPAVPLAPALVAQTASAQQPTEAPGLPALQFSAPDTAADTVLRFFDPRQFATLRRLSELFEPALGGGPGAIEARVPEFLDFLLNESGRERRQLYLSGLDRLEYDAQVRFGKPFAQVSDSQAAELLAPLAQPWSYVAPDSFTEFLRGVREDVRTATRNSYEWAQAGRPGGGGSYWKKVE